MVHFHVVSRKTVEQWNSVCPLPLKHFQQLTAILKVPGNDIYITPGEISSEIDRSSLCDIEKSSFKCFEIGLKMILPTQVHTQRITKTLLVHLPDL